MAPIHKIVLCPKAWQRQHLIGGLRERDMSNVAIGILHGNSAVVLHELLHAVSYLVHKNGIPYIQSKVSVSARIQANTLLHPNFLRHKGC